MALHFLGKMQSDGRMDLYVGGAMQGFRGHVQAGVGVDQRRDPLRQCRNGEQRIHPDGGGHDRPIGDEQTRVDAM